MHRASLCFPSLPLALPLANALCLSLPSFLHSFIHIFSTPCCLLQAYYLQYKNVRPDYLKNFFEVANWKNVAERLAAAKA